MTDILQKLEHVIEHDLDAGRLSVNEADQLYVALQYLLIIPEAAKILNRKFKEVK